MKVVSLLVVLMVLMGGLEAVELCKMSENGLAACKPSVTTPDPVDPTPECCQAVAGADLECLCSYKNSMLLPAFGVDPDLAIALPSKCMLPPPPC